MSEDEELLDEDESDQLNWIAILAVAVVVLALIGGSVWYFFIRENPEEAAGIVRPEWVPPENLVAEDLIPDGMFPELIISPYDSQGRYYLVMQLRFKLGDRDKAMKVILGRPGALKRVQNIVIDIFSSYTVDELRQPKFKEEARQAVIDELNEMAGWKGIPPEMQGMAEEDLPKPPLMDIYIEKFILN